LFDSLLCPREACSLVIAVESSDIVDGDREVFQWANDIVRMARDKLKVVML
jgi:hypothetical protein